MILAAGEGTRLRPLTLTVPKCMAVVGEKPILAHAVERLAAFGVREIVINLFHLPQTIVEYFGGGRQFGVTISYSRETSLLGTAGAVGKVREFFDGPFFVWYGDNLSTCNLERLHAFHAGHCGEATIALHHRGDPTHSGIVEMGDGGRITRFLEKPGPDEVFSHWVNAGIYILESGVLDTIPRYGCADFGKDVFPRLLACGIPVYGYQMGDGEGLWWIDTIADLQRVQETWTRWDPPASGAKGANSA